MNLQVWLVIAVAVVSLLTSGYLLAQKILGFARTLGVRDERAVTRDKEISSALEVAAKNHIDLARRMTRAERELAYQSGALEYLVQNTPKKTESDPPKRPSLAGAHESWDDPQDSIFRRYKGEVAK